MKRVLVILTFLLAGAVVNVAVAWGLSIRAPAIGPSVQSPPDHEGLYIHTSSRLEYWCQVTYHQGYTDVVWERAVIETRTFSGDVVVSVEDETTIGSTLYEISKTRLLTEWMAKHDIIDSNKLWAGDQTELKKFSAALKQARDSLETILSSNPDWIGEETLPRWARDAPELFSWAQVRRASGWPVVTVWYEGAFVQSVLGPTTLSGGWRLPECGFLGPGQIIAHRVIPGGFAVNTLFYAAILWLLIHGPFALRRFMRARRGLCPACAYPVSDSAVCTECGRELPRGMT